FLPKLSPSACSHGGVPGRGVKTNIEQHLGSVFGFTTDIANFFPSISHDRIHELFLRRFECSPDVARVFNRLCTYQHHLALGLVTSPLLADQVMQPIDARIAAACSAAGLPYTRFVDDISITGHFDMDQARSGIP